MVSLPLLFFCLVALISHSHHRSLPDSLLRAAVIWGTAVAGITELLGLFHAVTPRSLAFSWLALCCPLSAYYLWALRKRRYNGGHAAAPCPRVALPRALRPSIAALVLLAGTVGLTALLSQPGPMDALLYHMPRALLWLQYRTVEHYPTTYYQQLFQPPWSEYACLHIYALASGDRFVNLLTFGFYLGTALAAACAAGEIGAQRFGQVVAAVFYLTLPQGILSASGTKNDHALAFWVTAALYFALRYLRTRELSDGLFLALAIALAVLTKGTAWLWLLPVALLFVLWKDLRPGTALRALILVAAAVLMLAGPHYRRNVLSFGSPLGCLSAHCAEHHKFMNDAFGPRFIAANVLRNLALHTTVPLLALNEMVFQTVVRLCRSLGVDPQDPRITWSGVSFAPQRFRAEESVAGNPVHLVVAVIVSLLLLRKPGSLSRPFAALSVGCALAFVGFSAMLRWQPWHTRLHLPLFALLAGCTGYAVPRAVGPVTGAALLNFLLVYAYPYAVSNEARPLNVLLSVPRQQLYRDLSAATAVRRALQDIRCEHVALDAPVGSDVYGLLHGLRVGLGRPEVTYLSRDPRFAGWYRNRSLKACAVIYVDCDALPSRSQECNQLGEPVRFGRFSLITGYYANWEPGQGWEVRRRATTVPAVVTAVPAARLPVTLRPDDADQYPLLTGVTGDRWVTDKGIHIPLLLGGHSGVAVSVRGFLPPWSGLAPLPVVMRCGDAPSQTITLQSTGWFTLNASLPCPERQLAMLAIQPTKSFRPVDRGAGPDVRTLVFGVQEVRISPRVPSP